MTTPATTAAATVATTAVKQGFFRRTTKSIGDYFNRLSEDYSIVFVETIEEIPKQPLKALASISALAGAITAIAMNPSEENYLERLAEWRVQMGTVPNMVHSPRADATLVDRTSMVVNRRQDFYNCILFSLIIRRKYDRRADLYLAQDSNLRDWPWNEVFKNVVDIGAFGKFWMLEKQFVDYDINTDEWKDSSVAVKEN